MITYKKLLSIFGFLALIAHTSQSSASDGSLALQLYQPRPKQTLPLGEDQHLVVIQGTNNGFENLDKLFRGGDDSTIHYAESPQLTADLGQGWCQHYLQKTMQPLINDDSVKRIIIFASSQGTATALNYIAEHSNKIVAVILESVIASGNSALHHTLKNSNLKKVTQLPFSHYWVPFIAKCRMPFYSPAASQPIHRVKEISKDIPIIILNSPEDFSVPFSDTEALYTGLAINGHTKTYIIPVETSGPAYGGLLDHLTQNQIEIISKISQAQNMREHQQNQPDAHVGLENYELLLKREKRIQVMDLIIKGTLLSIICYYLCYKFTKKDETPETMPNTQDQPAISITDTVSNDTES